MCGIAGVFSFAGQVDSHRGVMATMVNQMSRRGPDAEGYWTDGRHCAFGFRRLSILDLSQEGNQPQTAAGERYALVFNGEVYNFRDLRLELEDTAFAFARRAMPRSSFTH